MYNIGEFVYFRSSLDFHDLNNGDSFMECKPQDFIGKPVGIDFASHSPDSIVGTVLDAYIDREHSRMFETFIGPYYPDGSPTIQILASIKSDVANKLNLRTTNNISMGCTGFKADENSPMEIDGVSLIKKF